MSLDHAAPFVKPQTEEADLFLGGRLRIAQPRDGFRAGLDSVLLGAAVTRGEGRLLELGAGSGIASLVALSDHSDLRAVLVDDDPAMLALARGNVAVNGFEARAEIVAVDITSAAVNRIAAGLAADAFATILANPPFYDEGKGTPSPRRSAARAMPADGLDAWVKAAATHAAPGGELIIIHLAARLPRLLESLDRRFGAITVLPLSPRAGEPPHRILVRGIKGSRAPFRLLASRPMHAEDGRAFLTEWDAVFRGEARLHW